MDYTWQALAAAGVLGLLGTALWWLRRRGLVGLAPGVRGGGRKLETLERLALGPQHTLHLVRVGEEALLVACSPTNCAVLERVPARPMEFSVGARR
jgi:flagellar biosynthetic protein FliO